MNGQSCCVACNVIGKVIFERIERIKYEVGNFGYNNESI